MHSLFNLHPELNVPLTYPQNWHAVRDGLRDNLTKVIRFYRNRPMTVESNHFVVRILQSITVPKTQHILRYYDNVSAISLNLAMALKMTSSIYQGRVFPGVFYGEGNTEIIIAHDTPFNPIEADRNWQNLCPIRVLRHPRSDLGMNLPDGENTGAETGVAVIAINIPMLAVQYRAWRNEEQRIQDITGENMRSVMQFVHMYVLPNMLFSQTDVAVFNRYRNYAVGAPIGESYKKHSFYLIDYSKRLDSVIQYQLESLGKSRRGFIGIMRNTLTVTKESMDGVLTFPDLAPTRQVIWALAVAALPGLDYLLTIAGTDSGHRNQGVLNTIKRTLLKLSNNSVISSVLSGDVEHDIKQEFAYLESRL